MFVNIGSVLELELVEEEDETERFSRLFFMLAAQSRCALHSKPVISYDGGFLKSDHWAHMQVLVSSVQDGENHDCFVSITIAGAESKDNYIWTIQQQRQNKDMDKFLSQEGLVVPTDRAKGLKAAIQDALPNAIPRFCNLHLLGNIPGRNFTKHDRGLYWRAVKAQSVRELPASVRDYICASLLPAREQCRCV
jgi:hypothetical protein